MCWVELFINIRHQTTIVNTYTVISNSGYGEELAPRIPTQSPPALTSPCGLAGWHRTEGSGWKESPRVDPGWVTSNHTKWLHSLPPEGRTPKGRFKCRGGVVCSGTVPVVLPRSAKPPAVSSILAESAGSRLGTPAFQLVLLTGMQTPI